MDLATWKLLMSLLRKMLRRVGSKSWLVLGSGMNEIKGVVMVSTDKKDGEHFPVKRNKMSRDQRRMF